MRSVSPHRWFVRPLAAFAFLGGVLLCVPSLVLLVASATGRGRGVALVGFCLAAGLVLAWLSVRIEKRRRTVVVGSVLAFVAGGVLYGICVLLTPKGVSSPDAAFREVYLGPGHYRRWALTNVVPEEDQFRVGMALMSLVDSSMSGARGRKLRRAWERIYREMERAPQFRAVGSALRHAYAELFSNDFDSGHMYVYVPPTGESRKRPLPVILFLHGNLGNFKGYMWVWKAFADAYGVAVVSPSFGNGNWQRRGGVDAVERARQWCLADGRFDARRIFLACLSNGGRGMVRAVIAHPRAYRGLISISGYLEYDLISSKAFADAWRGCPMLVVQGGKDDRVPEEDVRECVDRLRLEGVRVQYVLYPERGHFLFFTERKRVVSEIGKWMRGLN